MQRLLDIGKWAAVVGGAAWTIKSLVIMLLNDNFQPIEGLFYFVGVGGILLGALGLGAFFGIRATGITRWLVFVIAIVVGVFVTAVASSIIQNAVADAYQGGNIGIEEEMGILTPGVIWLIIGLFLVAGTRTRSSSDAQAATPSP